MLVFRLNIVIASSVIMIAATSLVDAMVTISMRGQNQHHQQEQRQRQQQLQQLYSRGLLSRPRPNLYVLGTVHIGSKSARDAQVLIETVRPSNVVLEVPPSRMRRILLRGGQNGEGGGRRGRRRTMEEVAATNSNDDNDNLDNNGAHVSPERMKKERGEGGGGENGKVQVQPITSTSSGGNNNSQRTTNVAIMNAIQMLPALWEGLKAGGLSGLLFSTVIVWPSLIKRSTTTGEALPRENEFEAAIYAARDVDATIIPADLEFEDLIQNVARSMNEKNPLLQWTTLGITILSESIGLRQGDPVRRRRGESMVEWEDRRRDIKTARASRSYGEISTPALSRVLVEERDTEFARICMDILNNDEKGNETTVCIVGLVHLDGIVGLVTNE